MRSTSWKVLLALTFGSIIGIIGVSIWELNKNDYDAARIGLSILLILCVVCCGFIIISISTTIKAIENTLLAVSEIKTGLVEAQQMLREYEDSPCSDIPKDNDDCIEKILDY